VGIESQKVPKALNGNNGSWNRILFRDNCLEKHLERVPGTPAEFGEEFSIIEKVSPEDFWYAEDEVAVGNGLEHFFTQIFPKFHHPLLMTWWTEMAAFAWKSQQNFVTAVSTPDARKAIMKDTAIEVAINHLSHIGPGKAILLGIALIVELFQRFKMVFNTLVILRSLGIARTIYWRGVGHGRFSLQRGSKNARRYIL
jgi:hypothetical protein